MVLLSQKQSVLPPQPKLEELPKPDQFYYHENLRKREARWRGAKLLAIALLGVAIAYKPANDSVKWAYRFLGFPTTAKPSLEVNFKPDEDFNAPLKVGDKVLSYEVTSGFGKREKPCPSCSEDHKGVDIATPVGTPVYAIGKLGSKSSFHDGFVDVACPFNPSNPPEGMAAYVTSPLLPEYEIELFHLNECYSGRHPVGSMIAKSGNSGASSGPHLHVGVKLKGELIDPPRGIVSWLLQGKEPTKAPTKPVVERLRNAIAGQESNHDHKAINADSGALGYGQIMPDNIKSWSTQCLGSPLTEQEFLKDKTKQVKIIDCKLEEALKQVAPTSKSEEEQIRKAASIWYSGDPSLFNNARPQTYGGNSYPSIAEYTETVYKRFKKQ
jgi:murein DD-endopeptidase MepM/ murein hydrolase activator NlpD